MKNSDTIQKAGIEVKMGTKRKKRPSEVGKIKIKKEGDKKEEIAVLSMALSQKSEESVWSWLEEFTMEWSETLITRKRKKPTNPLVPS